jgi:hypothetical protein
MKLICFFQDLARQLLIPANGAGIRTDKMYPPMPCGFAYFSLGIPSTTGVTTGDIHLRT